MINTCKCGGGWPEKLAFIWQTEQRLIRLTDRPAIGSWVAAALVALDAASPPPRPGGGQMFPTALF